MLFLYVFVRKTYATLVVVAVVVAVGAVVVILIVLDNAIVLVNIIVIAVLVVAVAMTIVRLRTPNQGVPKGLEQPHEKKGGDLEIGTWPRLKCTFYGQNLVLQNQPYFSRFMEGEADFRAASRKERPCFAAECGLDRLGHTWTPDGLEQAHEKNGPVLLQNVGLTALGTHGHRMV